MKQPDLPLQGILPRKRGNSLVTQAQPYSKIQPPLGLTGKLLPSN
ncbi:MAG: hypothetical protein WBV36_09015 [Terriglobales bacterium]